MEPDRQISEFNMAVSWLNRLNYYFYKVDEAAENLDLYAWFQGLMILNRELVTEMKADEETSHNKKAKELFTQIQTQMNQQKRTGRAGIPPALYWELHEYETYLRKIMDKSGLLKRVQEDALKALR